MMLQLQCMILNKFYVNMRNEIFESSLIYIKNRPRFIVKNNYLKYM